MDVYIYAEAWVVTQDWQRVGFELWKHWAYPRDYLLPAADNNLSGIRKVRAKYSDAATYSQALFGILQVPKFNHGTGWELSDEKLLKDDRAAQRSA